MGRQLHGDLQIIASGGKLYSFLNAMQSVGICCRKQQCRGNSYRFYIYEKTRKPVQALAEQYGVTLQITPQKTLRYFLHRYRFRFGIPAGLLLVAGLLFYGSNIIMTIDVIGNETVSEQEILAVLQEDNVQRGSWIPSLDLANCEHHLRAGIESLAWVGIRHTGNRLVVEVMEATPQPAITCPLQCGCRERCADRVFHRPVRTGKASDRRSGAKGGSPHQRCVGR